MKCVFFVYFLWFGCITIWLYFREIPMKENWSVLAENEQSHDLLQKEITERMALEGEIGFYQVHDLEKSHQVISKESELSAASKRGLSELSESLCSICF